MAVYNIPFTGDEITEKLNVQTSDVVYTQTETTYTKLTENNSKKIYFPGLGTLVIFQVQIGLAGSNLPAYHSWYIGTVDTVPAWTTTLSIYGSFTNALVLPEGFINTSGQVYFRLASPGGSADGITTTAGAWYLHTTYWIPES